MMLRSHHGRPLMCSSVLRYCCRRLHAKNHNNTTTGKPAPDKTKLSSDAEQEALDFLAERGRALGASNLTRSERKLILNAAAGKDGKLRREDWETFLSRRSLENQERLTLSAYLAKSHDVHLGQRMLQYTARLGVAFFALTGAHTAGEEAGMHIVGSTMVGCVTALGGGTINAVVTGATPVGWVRDPSFLIISIGASFVGFYVWPLVEQLLQGEVKDDNDGNVPANHGEEKASSPSALRYGLESVALGALAVVGAQQGIVYGLHPLVSSTLGVTIAFGGVLRDLMCQRDLALGASTGCQSYGIASFSGAAVYVALRELHVWNCAGSTSKLLHGGIPIGLRILLGFGTVFGIRAVAWHNKPDGLLLTMNESAEMNRKRLNRLISLFRSEPKDKS